MVLGMVSSSTVLPLRNSTFLYSTSLPNNAFCPFVPVQSHLSSSSFFTLCFKTTPLPLPSSLLQFQRTQFSSTAFLQNVDNRLRVSALKSRRKGGSTVMEMDDSDDEVFAFDGDFDDDFEGDDDDGDVGMFFPFGRMKKWLENKPRGFGEGKVYDTSIEDKLLEEMEQSRQAQLTNVNKLKNNPIKPAFTSLKTSDKKKAPEAEVIPCGIRVRVVNLPKKKNIHRDLKAAFKGVPGIINISPAVSGNKKTKDPICKGYAFVDFKTEEDAFRFVQRFSAESISFGRIQKQIKCEMLNSLSSNSAREQSTDDAYEAPELAATASEESFDADFDTDDSYSDLLLETTFDESDTPDFETDELEVGNVRDKVEVGDIRDNIEAATALVPDSTDYMEPPLKLGTNSTSSNQKERIKAIERKQRAKAKQQKIPKLEIPGSAKRLKIKEKALLTGVFAKYGGKTDSASGEKC